MSLEIVRQVNQQHPQLLQQNVNRACYQFVVLVIKALRAAGHEAYHVCKSPGEGQFTPPDFAPRVVVGLDGKNYPCSGVSHDAIWADGIIVDTIARGNDSPDPIGMTGEPVWNAVPPEHWRPNNPPLKDGGTTPVPPTPQPPQPTIPSYEALGGDAFFRAQIGGPLQADMTQAGPSHGGGPLNDGSSVWFSRPTYRILEAYARGQVPDTAAIIKSVRNEWRAILTAHGATGLPPL